MPAVSSRELHNAMQAEEQHASRRRRPHKAARINRSVNFQELLEKEPEEFKKTMEYQVLSGKSKVHLKSLNQSINRHKARIMRKQATSEMKPTAAAASEMANPATPGPTEPPASKPGKPAVENLHTEASAAVVEEAASSPQETPTAEEPAAQQPEPVIEIPEDPKGLSADLLEVPSIKDFPLKSMLLNKDTSELIRRSLMVSLFLFLSKTKPGLIQTNENGVIVLTGKVVSVMTGVALIPNSNGAGGVLISVMGGSEAAIAKITGDFPECDISNLTVQEALQIIELFV